MGAAAFFIMLSFFANGSSDFLKIACPDLVCVGKVVEASRKRPEIRRVRVFTEEPAKFGPGDVYTPAIADYQWG